MPIRQERDKTLLEAELITGKPHQIRAHLASIGHPLLGDYKYGDRSFNEQYRRKYQVEHQLLHAYKIVFPPLTAPFGEISERTPMKNIWRTGWRLFRRYRLRLRRLTSTNRAGTLRSLISNRRVPSIISASCRGFRSVLTLRNAPWIRSRFRTSTNIRWLSWNGSNARRGLPFF